MTGKPKAKPANSKAKPKKSKKSDSGSIRINWQLITGTLFLLIVSAVGFTHLIPREFAIYYLVISLITLIAYGIDKQAAIRENPRIPELVLHAFSVFGGWPGALLAQQLFRHKTIKVKFQVVFWITMIVNCALFYKLLITPEGTAMLKMVI